MDVKTLEQMIDRELAGLGDAPAVAVRPEAMRAWKAAVLEEAHRTRRRPFASTWVISGGIAAAAVLSWFMLYCPGQFAAPIAPEQVARHSAPSTKPDELLVQSLDDWSQSMDESAARLAAVFEPDLHNPIDAESTEALDDWIDSFRSLEELGG